MSAVASPEVVVVVAEAPEGRAVARVPPGRAGTPQPEAERWVDSVEVGLDVADFAMSDDGGLAAYEPEPADRRPK